MTAIDFLKKLISFESLSTKEKEIADWLELELKSIPNVSVQRIDDNLLASYGEGKSAILFNTHLDVVPSSPNHEYPAFEPFVSEGKVFGRGSTDAKGSLTAMVQALKKISEQKIKPQHRLLFAFTACEEAYGNYNGVQLLKSQGYFDSVESAIVGEPTSLQPCLAQKGILLLELVMKGKSGHAARISKTDNLLFKLPDVLKKLELFEIETENPWLGKTKITPTRITGGTANNMAPEEITIIVDIRTIPDVSSTNILNQLTTLLPEVEIRVRSDRFKAVSTQANSNIAKLCHTVTAKDFFGSPTCSDWAFLGEIPTIKLGPGHSEQSHTANESIEIEQLENGIDVYFQIMSQS
ncbi:M20/M25/M40 family metallo-hydrolase [bacterium]|nr:MAG: M20/M25/M40 family metallo-hydrolase [bacterium]